MKEFYDFTYRLKFLVRYSNVPRINDENVAEHSFFVCMVLIKLHEKYRFSLRKALEMAISHDLPEAATNDVSHMTKKMYPEIEGILKKIEYDLSLDLPKSSGESIRKLQGNSKTARFVMFADAAQCYQYACTEVSMGNKGYMLEVKKGSKNRIKQFKKELKKYERKD